MTLAPALRSDRAAAFVSAALGVLLLALAAPGYLWTQGLPLDDAWIHAVYGRSLARGQGLAYNPGVAATGETSPMWALLLAVPHVVAQEPELVVPLIKLLGLALHGLCAAVACSALGGPAYLRFAAGILVALHPDLVAAAASGMEVPLAGLFGLLLFLAGRQARPLPYFALAAAAPFARPELAVLCVLVPLSLPPHAGRPRGRTLAAAGILGVLAWAGSSVGRNVVVSGLPLPATFYAKVGATGAPLLERLYAGWATLSGLSLLEGAVLLGLSALLAAAGLVAGDMEHRTAASAAFCALAFFGVSAALVHAVDPAAFYHQRYLLPGLPLLLAAAPALLAGGVARAGLAGAKARRTASTAVLLLAGAELIAAPARYRRLANDARNIDDVQVTEGRALHAAPASDVLWAIDAGATRYFGGAFVVDMIGLNTPALLGARAQAYLDGHPPRWLQVVKLWSAIDEASARQLPHRSFQPSSEYTITRVPAFQAMSTHYLVHCATPLATGGYQVRGRTFGFRCAP